MVTETRLAYRPNEAARVLGCSRDTVDRLIERGELKSFKLLATRFISAEEITRVIREREEHGD